VRLLRILWRACLSEMPQTQMRAGSCLRVVRTDGLRGSADPQTHRDERPGASGWCARVLVGAGGLVGVRHEEHFEHLIVHVSLASTTTEQERTHARSIAPNAQELPPRSPMKASRKPGRAARSFLGWNDTSGVVFLHISRLTSESAHELTALMPSERLHHTYSTPHTD